MPTQIAQLSYKASEVATALQTLIQADVTLGLDRVYYGEQDRIAITPAVSIDEQPTSYVRHQTGFRNQVEFRIFVLLYFAKIVSEEEFKAEADALADDLIDVVMDDNTLASQNGGEPLVIHGQVTRKEPGVAILGGERMRAVRLTWEALSYVQF